MSRPVRMKMYRYRFMIPTTSGVDMAVEIMPIFAKEQAHAETLVAQKHSNYFKQYKMHIYNATFEEIHIGSDMWFSSINGYASPDIKTIIPF